jgi:sugar lactone lactonase YvrE
MSAGPRDPSVLVDDLRFPEGPRWHDGRLWFSDMHSGVVLALGLDGRVEEIVRVPGEPSGLGWRPDGTLLVVSMQDQKLMAVDAAGPGGLREVADLSALAGFHCNDMVVDARGRAYVGNFGFDLHAGQKPCGANLILVDTDDSVRVAAPDLMFPNGTVITPDGRTLIVGESFAGRLAAFDVHDDGSLSNRRVWAQLEGAIPDGICLDEEGGIWVASPVSAEVLRVREGGEVTNRIPVRTQAFACMLGGDARRTLFICTAGDSDPAKTGVATDGCIEFVDVEIPGAGLP